MDVVTPQAPCPDYPGQWFSKDYGGCSCGGSHRLTDRKSETVTTWADAYGRWHARIDFPFPGYGPAHMNAHADRIRAKARRAIRRELESRGHAGEGWRCGVSVVDNSLDHLNRMQSMTYAEGM